MKTYHHQLNIIYHRLIISILCCPYFFMLKTKHLHVTLSGLIFLTDRVPEHVLVQFFYISKWFILCKYSDIVDQEGTL